MSLATAMARARAARPLPTPASIVSSPLRAAAAATPDATGDLAIAPEIQPFVIAVGLALGLSPERLLAELSPLAARGRSIAASLAVRRARLPSAVAAGHFGMTEQVAQSALGVLDRVLTLTRASFTHAALGPLAATVAAAWPMDEEPYISASTVATIKRTVCSIYRVSRIDLESRRRTRTVVQPRMIAMYLARRFTLRSYPEIGHAFGRDHTTVLHAVDRIAPFADAVARRLTPDASIAAWVTAIRAVIDARGWCERR